MKKIFSLLFAFISITGNAQPSFNVRAGLGVVPMLVCDNDCDGSTVFDTYRGTTLSFQINFPVNIYRTLTVSPTFAYTKANDEPFWELPIYLGYKIRLGHKNIIYPKIGPMAAANYAFWYGLSTELAWEYKYFVIAANYFYLKEGAGDDISGGFHLVLGCKF